MLGFADSESVELRHALLRDVPRLHKVTRRVITSVLLFAGVMVVLAARTYVGSVDVITVQLSEVQRDTLDDSTILNNGGDHQSESSSDSTCADEFGQCAGKDGDGQSMAKCCPDYFWCARFGDWWGVCLPSKVYHFPEHPENRQQQQQQQRHDDRDGRAERGHDTGHESEDRLR